MRVMTVEYLRAFMKVSKDVQLGTEDMDFMHEQLTAVLEAKLLAMTKDEGFIWSVVEPPSFWDWLFRRDRHVKIHYKISQLVNLDEYEGPMIVQLNQDQP